jgi:hypothetical protein
VVCRPHRPATLLCSVFSTAERSCGKEEPNRCGDGTQPIEGKTSADEVLGEAVVTAVYLLNRALTKSLTRQTPYEAWHGAKPSVVHLLLTVNFLQPSHEVTSNVGIDLLF